MTLKEVLQLAKDKGYDSILCHIARYGGDATLPRTITNSAEELCELTLIEKWLRDDHKKHVQIICIGSVEYSIVSRGWSLRITVDNSFPTYEKALLEGIREALILIK